MKQGLLKDIAKDQASNFSFPEYETIGVWNHGEWRITQWYV
jgi:hypothetical protein